MLSMLVGDGAGGIDMEAEVYRLMGFDSAIYALMERPAEFVTSNEN